MNFPQKYYKYVSEILNSQEPAFIPTIPGARLHVQGNPRFYQDSYRPNIPMRAELGPYTIPQIGIPYQSLPTQRTVLFDPYIRRPPHPQTKHYWTQAQNHLSGVGTIHSVEHDAYRYPSFQRRDSLPTVPQFPPKALNGRIQGIVHPEMMHMRDPLTLDNAKTESNPQEQKNGQEILIQEIMSEEVDEGAEEQKKVQNSTPAKRFISYSHAPEPKKRNITSENPVPKILQPTQARQASELEYYARFYPQGQYSHCDFEPSTGIWAKEKCYQMPYPNMAHRGYNIPPTIPLSTPLWRGVAISNEAQQHADFLQAQSLKSSAQILRKTLKNISQMDKQARAHTKSANDLRFPEPTEIHQSVRNHKKVGEYDTKLAKTPVHYQNHWVIQSNDQSNDCSQTSAKIHENEGSLDTQSEDSRPYSRMSSNQSTAEIPTEASIKPNRSRHNQKVEPKLSWTHSNQDLEQAEYDSHNP